MRLILIRILISALMFDIQRNLHLDELPGGETVLCFQFPDLEEFRKWWLVCENGEVDLCYQDPGKDVNAFVTASSRDMMEVWMGDLSLSKALTDERVKLVGETAVCNRFRKWFPLSSAAGIPRPLKAERTTA